MRPPFLSRRGLLSTPTDLPSCQARMATAPSPDTPRPRWIKGIHWRSSPPFRVDWLSTTSVPFYYVGHLENRLNDNLPVLVGKDGQEIEKNAGGSSSPS